MILTFSLTEVHGPKQTAEAAHVIRIDVNRALSESRWAPGQQKLRTNIRFQMI
jgi:hypothetical protein